MSNWMVYRYYGTINLSDDEDKTLLSALIETGFFKPTVTLNDLDIDGDDQALYISDATNGQPLAELQLLSID